MPKVEIDEVELQQSNKLRTTVEKILKNPKTRRGFMEQIKIVEPETVIPELEATSHVDDKLTALEKQLAEEKKAREEAEARREQEGKLRSIADQQERDIAALRGAGWTEEGIKGVKELAEKHGILDINIAASHFEKLHPPQQPVASTSRSGGWDFLQPPAEGDANADFVKQLVESRGENDALLSRRASEALAEVRGQRR